MNADVLFDKKTFAAVARAFLEEKKLVTSKAVDAQPIWQEIFAKTLTHMGMTFLALLMAIVVAVPLGIMLSWRPVLSTIVVSVTGLLQTIPSIALLAVMIPLLGIGVLPAVVALFMYALLPIVQNTITGLQSVDPRLKDTADGIGMNRYQKLRWVELPLALPSLLAGIRTAAVINIGTATLAAFIGAGGLGEFIVTGLALNNTSLILRGAIPAALLAILVEFLFSRIEKRWGPKHLR
ncbi:MAG: ABC transporter permease [Cyclobacteriaceae bacterium]|nr:ABC transporter permease [Cyclobacteriaceae bacterium]